MGYNKNRGGLLGTKWTVTLFAITKEGFLDEKNSFCNIRGSAFY